VRKAPEFVVMLAPAVVVTLLVVLLGFTMGGADDDKDAPRQGADPAASAGEVSGDLDASSPQGGAVAADVRVAKLPGPRVVIKARPRPKWRAYDGFSFRLATYNLLGHNHTVGGGDAARFADSSYRMGLQLAGMANAGVDVVGLQEFQPQQIGSLLARAGGTWDVWPANTAGRFAGANSIAWRQAEFELVETHLINITYFSGAEWPMPYVKLRHLGSGQEFWVANFHNPATKGNPANYHWRRVATGREINLANQLEATGLPVFFTGDFNERAEYFCPLTTQTKMQAANGGSTGTSCAPPSRMEVDWIFGSERVDFSDYAAIDLPRASDHPLVVSTVTVPQHRERIVYPKKKRQN
jgi:endonuclease/exonuclease/phosphatase family metal-dependent hydrolase